MPASTHASPDASAGEGHARRTLPKESLIRKNAEYSLCYAEGRRVHTRHFLLFVLERENEDAGLKEESSRGLRMGCAVSRKVGRAVVRNRVKRLLRECFRLYLRELKVSARFVAVAKRQTCVEKLSLADVVAEIKPALERHFARRGAS
ncbi:MAG: ribonuclease P protein component [Desulfovibrio sp.]|nr:ribonuclease P protein component [Desulfovibrio sp.]